MRFYLLCVLLLVVPVFVASAAVDFTRNLYAGMHGEDVLSLQKFLNTDTETRVAETGAGSLGNETDYFGLGTKRALIKFQEKYRAEVLTPVGLTSGTGFFGEKTRAKMNALMGVSVVSALLVPNQPIVPAVLVTPVATGTVIVMFPSQYSGTPGSMITISGAGFTATNNTIYFGNDHAVVNAVSWNGQSITFKVPNIPKGIYPLFVKNASGESNKEQFFIVTDGVTPEPKIDSSLPTQASLGGIIEIKGSGFTQTGNMLLTGVGFFKNISSKDGNSLSFIIPIDAFPATVSPKISKFHVQIWIHVVNDNGVSNAQSFILEI